MNPRKCPDCGSLRFNAGGAAALDEAREVGFAQGAEGCVAVLNDEANDEATIDELSVMFRALSPPAVHPPCCDHHGPGCPDPKPYPTSADDLQRGCADAKRPESPRIALACGRKGDGR